MNIRSPDIKYKIEIIHLELVRLRIAYLNECDYSINLHYRELKNFGESDIKLSLVAVWNHAYNFSEQERALFALTDYIINLNNNKSYKQVYTLLNPHFSHSQVVALTYAIKQIDLWTRSIKHLNNLTSL